MIQKTKAIIEEFRAKLKQVANQGDEQIWASVFHDTIKDREWLNKLSVSPGRWAANYSFLYVLVRILSDYKPKKIIEFGLGESSKIISSFLENDLHDSTHLIIEHDENWVNAFNERFRFSKNSRVKHLPLKETNVNGFPVHCYQDIDKEINEIFDVYIIDGPFGSPAYSRYDICRLAEELKPQDEFIILMDDYNRKGEQDTIKALTGQLAAREIKIHLGVFSGNKAQCVIASEKYRHILTV